MPLWTKHYNGVSCQGFWTLLKYELGYQASPGFQNGHFQGLGWDFHVRLKTVTVTLFWFKENTRNLLLLTYPKIEWDLTSQRTP